MADEKNLVLRLGGNGRTLLTSDGKIVHPPAGWKLLPPGDAGLTRRVKAMGSHWLVQEKRGRRTYSKGIWAKGSHIVHAREEIEAKRATPAYIKKMATDVKRREKKQEEYVDDFHQAILLYLQFHRRHSMIAEKIAGQVARHATPVGSGTVARTQRIPLEKRAEAAVIAWMRHKTTAYDQMSIAQVKGRRREVRRELAHQSVNLLARYRQGDDIPLTCPLYRAVAITSPL
ncbi:DUF2293 domain-containing protein [Desulfotalea psychrophila]|nr:DUF2293 domain-containing protein [Desulfotalea psychrophila]